jgi:DNA-binding XRE family transcriptional regulator
MDRKSPVDSNIGQRLKEYRQHRGMTVRELAEAAHVTPGQISRYEHGRARITDFPGASKGGAGNSRVSLSHCVLGERYFAHQSFTRPALIVSFGPTMRLTA